MSTSKEYKEYVLEQIEPIGNILCRPMMGEYLLYYNGTLFGGIYDNRLLIKISSTNEKYGLSKELPYSGAKLMYSLDLLDDKNRVEEIIINTCKGLASNKKKK